MLLQLRSYVASARELWQEIDAANSLLIEIINALNQDARDDREAYEQTMRNLGSRRSSEVRASIKLASTSVLKCR